MKYIKEKNEQVYDYIGITLGCMYLFFTYLGDSIYFPTVLKKGTLLLFLAYGALTVLLRLIDGTFAFSMYSIWYGIVICYAVITFPFSSYQNSINSNHFYEMIVCFVITLLLGMFVDSEKKVCWICWAYVLSSVLMIIMMFRSGKLVGNYKERLGDEIVGNANIFATFIMYSVMYALWLLLCQNYSIQVKAFLCISILVNTYALILSAGRKFFMVPLIFMFFLLLMRNETSSARNVLKYILFMLIIIGMLYLVIMNVPMFYNAIGIRMEQFYNTLTGSGKADLSSITRSALRSAAIEGWLQRPLFGNGFDSFKYLKSPEVWKSGFAYSHCNYTELLHNGGLVWFALYYSIYGIVLKRTTLNKNMNCQLRAFSAAAIISQFVLEYGGVFYDIIASQVFLLIAVKMMESADQDRQKCESRYIYG